VILLMGIAGSGKGTQGKLLAEKEGYHVISTGELLRSYGSSDQHTRMHAGEILDDEEVTALLDKALAELADPDHVILDGYPRRVSQADWLLAQQKLGRFRVDKVLHLVASKQAVKQRLENRGRVDDHSDAIEERFSEYNRETLPILDHLSKAGVSILEIDAERPVEVIHDEITILLGPKN